ncbi:MAG TPA: hypothetical protein VI452_03310 [Marmoricola sp.]
MSTTAPRTGGSRDGTTGPPGHGRWEERAHRLHVRVVALRALLARWEARAPKMVAIARALFYPCALALVAYMGYKAARATDFSTLHWWPLAAAYLVALVWWLSLAGGWASLVADRSAVVPWCQTQVARYVPGGFWAVVARATTVQGRIRDKLTAVTAENTILLCVSMAIGALWACLHDWRWLPVIPVALAPLLVSRWLEKRTRISRRQVSRTAGVYAIGYIAYGVVGLLVQVAVSGSENVANPLYVAGAACVAWAVGLVVVFAPGGVGVRELVYIWMLASLLPTAQLEAAAVASRLVTVAAELTVLAVVTRPGARRARAERDAATTAASDDAEAAGARGSGD